MFDLDQMDTQTIALAQASLPPSLIPGVEAIGLKSVLFLVEGFGGQPLVVPKHQTGPGAEKFDLIAEFVGVDTALVLCATYGGEEIYIPKCDHMRRVLRNAEMTRDYEALLKVTSGLKAIRELCNRSGLSHRQVEDIVNGKIEAKPNMGVRKKASTRPVNAAWPVNS